MIPAFVSLDVCPSPRFCMNPTHLHLPSLTITHHLLLPSLALNVAGSRTIGALGTSKTIAFTTQGKTFQRNHHQKGLMKLPKSYKKYKISKMIKQKANIFCLVYIYKYIYVCVYNIYIYYIYICICMYVHIYVA